MELGIETARRNNIFLSLVFVFIQLHFDQWSSFLFGFDFPVAPQNFSFLATAHDCETGQCSREIWFLKVRGGCEQKQLILANCLIYNVRTRNTIFAGTREARLDFF